MTMRYIGGGHKRKYRVIDFKRDKDGVLAIVESIQYDPNRSARIALLVYADGEKRYILAPNGLQVARSWLQEAESLLRLAILYLWARSLWVPSFTTSNCIPEKVALWPEVQVLLHNWLLVKEIRCITSSFR
jgi:hypothetical protein